MSSHSLKEQQEQLRKTFILNTAKEILLEQGYIEMNMDELAARVGVSKTTLYKHFSSKEDLILDVVLRALRQIETIIQGLVLLDPSRPALSKLKTVLRKSVEYRETLAIMHLPDLPSKVLNHANYQRLRRRLTAQFVELVDTAKVEGDVATDRSTALIVQMIFSFFSPQYQRLIKAGIHSSSELCESFITIVLRGIQVKKKSARSKSRA